MLLYHGKLKKTENLRTSRYLCLALNRGRAYATATNRQLHPGSAAETQKGAKIQPPLTFSLLDYKQKKMLFWNRRQSRLLAPPSKNCVKNVLLQISLSPYGSQVRPTAVGSRCRRPDLISKMMREVRATLRVTVFSHTYSYERRSAGLASGGGDLINQVGGYLINQVGG